MFCGYGAPYNHNIALASSPGSARSANPVLRSCGAAAAAGTSGWPAEVASGIAGPRLDHEPRLTRSLELREARHPLCLGIVSAGPGGSSAIDRRELLLLRAQDRAAQVTWQWRPQSWSIAVA